MAYIDIARDEAAPLRWRRGRRRPPSEAQAGCAAEACSPTRARPHTEPARRQGERRPRRRRRASGEARRARRERLERRRRCGRRRDRRRDLRKGPGRPRRCYEQGRKAVPTMTSGKITPTPRSTARGRRPASSRATIRASPRRSTTACGCGWGGRRSRRTAEPGPPSCRSSSRTASSPSVRRRSRRRRSRPSRPRPPRQRPRGRRGPPAQAPRAHPAKSNVGLVSVPVKVLA